MKTNYKLVKITEIKISIVSKKPIRNFPLSGQILNPLQNKLMTLTPIA